MIGNGMETSGLEVNASLLRPSEDESEGLIIQESHIFRIDEEEAQQVNGRWPCLLAHLNNLFTLDKATEQYNFFWRDEGFELFPISTECDLRDGMEKSKDDVLNIYITVSVRKEESDEEDDDTEEVESS